MSAYQHHIRRRSWLAALLRALATICRTPLAVITLAVLASPIGPQVLIDYGAARSPGINTCAYIGSRGRFRTSVIGGCSLVIWADRRHE